MSFAVSTTSNCLPNQAETVPMSVNFLREKCCLGDDTSILENSLQKLSYQSLITLKTSPELNVVSIEAKKVVIQMKIDLLYEKAQCQIKHIELKPVKCGHSNT